MNMKRMSLNRIIIAGAGPAGMGCAHTLAKAGQGSFVIEKENEPGGLCRTFDFHGYLFDIGGHRFISKSEEINKLWHEVIGKDILKVKRLSRIYYRKKYFRYPLSFFNTFRNLGPIESLLCLSSYLRCKYIKSGDDSTFEGWIINRFGKRLYHIFFRTYTEKLWSAACCDISADWAQQRISGLSFKTAIKKIFLKMTKNNPKTLYKEFFYPRAGSGKFYHRLEEFTKALGGQFSFRKTITGIKHDAKKILSLEILDGHKGKREEIFIDYIFSSIPLPIFIKMLKPRPPKDVVDAAERLYFRSLLIVNIILDKEGLFPDQWIYVHSPEVRLCRIQNYKNWSPAMVADNKKTSLGLEYFCTENDDLWRMNDEDLIRYAIKELEKIDIISHNYLINGFVIRCPNVYPLYLVGYQKNVHIIREYLEGFSNLQMIGRGGLFRYDNSDHALLTGVYAARNFLGEGSYDIWKINDDGCYVES